MLSVLDLKKKDDVVKSEKMFLLIGNDAYMRESAFNSLFDKLNIANASFNQTNFNFLGSSSYDIKLIIETIQQVPFMSEKRLTVLKEFYPKDSEIKSILKAMENDANCESVIVIINSQQNDSIKIYEKFAIIVDCNHPSTNNVVEWVKRKVKSEGLEINQINALHIAEFCLCDMSRVSIETQKLIDLSKANELKEISSLNINNSITKDSEYKFYQMINAILERDKNKAYEILSHLFNDKVEPQKILISAYREFRKILYAVISDDKEQVLGQFNISSYVADKIRNQGRKYGVKQLKEIIDICSETDELCKSSGIAGCDLVENAFLKIINL